MSKLFYAFVAFCSVFVAGGALAFYVATNNPSPTGQMAPLPESALFGSEGGFTEIYKRPVITNVSVNRVHKDNQMSVFIRVPDPQADIYDVIKGPFTRQEADMYARDLYANYRGFCTDNCGRFTKPDDGPTLDGED